MEMADEAFYKICFDSLIDGLCVANEEGRIVMNNSACEEIFGYDEGELAGKHIEVLIPIPHHSVHQHFFNSYLKFPKKFKKGRGREFVGLHKSGEILDLEIGLNFFDFKGQRYAKALIAEIGPRKEKENLIKESHKRLENEVDRRTHLLEKAVSDLEKSNLQLKEEVRERIKAEEQVKKALEKEKELNLMQTKFLSMASHEFKTPLSGILTSAGLIEKYNEKNQNERIKNHVQKIINLVIQLNDILDDFLFLENSETGRYKFTSSRFMFCRLMQKIVKDATAILKPGQRIEITPCKSPLEVVQDKKVVDIIIRNLLYNAIKYSPENSQIDIRISLDDMVQIEIRDQGIGIPEESKQHIFERFYRAKNALHIQGTGIGLNIVKRHLHHLKGTVEIESMENMGTEVILRLPILSKETILVNRQKEEKSLINRITR